MRSLLLLIKVDQQQSGVRRSKLGQPYEPPPSLTGAVPSSNLSSAGKKGKLMLPFALRRAPVTGLASIV